MKILYTAQEHAYVIGILNLKFVALDSMLIEISEKRQVVQV